MPVETHADTHRATVRRLCCLFVLVAAAVAAAQTPLRQSTAVTVKVGPMLDAGDGVTPEAALTLHYDHIRLSKNGAAFGPKHDANDLTHDENGYYHCKLDTTDTGALGLLTLGWTDVNAAPIRHDYEVMTANAWDSLYSTDKLQVHVVEGDDNVVFDVNATDIGSGVWGALVASYTGETTFGGEVGGLDPNLTLVLADSNELQTDWHDGGRLDLIADLILADTDELQTDWTNGGRLDLILDAIKAMTDLISVETTTVASVDANDPNLVFTLTAGKDANDAYWMHAIMIEDATDSHSEVRWIYDWTDAREVTVEEPFSFDVEAGDRAWILGVSYGGYLYDIYERLGRSEIPVYPFDATGKTSPGARDVIHFQGGTDP